jgi:hypothetical protein
MDILNFISWIRGRRQVTSVDPTKTLIPVGLKDGRRDDEYLAGAISVEDLAAQIAPEPAYKVYTALLTQNGGSGINEILSGDLTIGVTYLISPTFGNPDWTNVGAPNNDAGTYFVATGTTPNSWGTPGENSLVYNPGAPVAIVLENTIGNIWFTYESVGNYTIKKTDNWDDEKTWYGLGGLGNPGSFDVYPGNPTVSIESSTLYLITSNNDFSTQLNNQLNKTPIEIRVYN